MRILVTGSRNWTDEDTIFDALQDYDPGRGSLSHTVTLVSGGCPTGADRIAEDFASATFGWQVEVHEAEWDKHGRAAGPIRNAHMVSLGADVCLGFPLGESRGTRGCMKLAYEAGIPVRVFEGGGRGE